jgi:hypothetical protein
VIEAAGIVMGMSGRTCAVMRARLERNSRCRPSAGEIGREICNALAAAHRQNV